MSAPASAPGPLRARPREPGGALVRALALVERRRLAHGECAAFTRDPDGTLLYQPAVLPTALVHDALGTLESSSPAAAPGALAVVPRRARAAFAATLRRLRAGARAFVAWQEEPDGTWRRHGRASALAPDLATTACAAAVMLEGGARASGLGARVAALARFTPGDDPAADAHALRFLALAGDDARRWRESVWRALEAGRGDAVFLHAAARAYAAGALDGARDPLLAALDGVRGGGALERALAAQARLDLDDDGPALRALGAELLTTTLYDGASDAEPYGRDGLRCPALVMALTLAALARWSAGGGAVQ